MRKRGPALLVAFGLFSVALAGPVLAAAPPHPQAEERMVVVDLAHVRGQLATAIEAEADQIPISVQLPASEVATVCGVSEAALEVGPAHCVATTTSMVLALTVRHEAQMTGRTPATPRKPAQP